MEAAGVKEGQDLKIVRDPRVFLVGRQTIDRAAIDRFLGEHELTWQTDTEVGAEMLAEIAGRVCYMSYGKGRKTNREFLEHIVEVGHGSVLEHGVWSFLIAGVSRSFTHELIRHRHFSYSQLSQRYVNESESDFVEPDVIATDPEMHAVWSEAVQATRRLMLTGTPIVNRPAELFPLLHCLDPKRWPTWTGFARRYCAGGYNGAKTAAGPPTATKLCTNHSFPRSTSYTISNTQPGGRFCTWNPATGQFGCDSSCSGCNAIATVTCSNP